MTNEELAAIIAGGGTGGIAIIALLFKLINNIINVWKVSKEKEKTNAESIKDVLEYLIGKSDVHSQKKKKSSTKGGASK